MSVPAAAPKSNRRKHPILRALAILLAVVAAVIITFFTIDVGPNLKKVAEQQGTKFFDRPMHIGKLSIVLRNGSFQVDDLVIEGLSPTDRPFLKAKRVTMTLPWWTFFTHELIVENVDMTDWEMLVEQFPGRHSFPRLGGPKKPKKGDPIWRITTTVRQVTARNGQFTYDDHTTPWLVVCRNLNVSVFKGFDTYRGTAQFTNGAVKILQYDAFPTDMQTRFKIDGGKIILEDINLKSLGASTKVTGFVDIPNWPTMLYNVSSLIDFPIQKAIYFKDMNFTVAGQGKFDGTFRFFKTPTGTGRELKGSFTSAEAGVNAWRFPQRPRVAPLEQQRLPRHRRHDRSLRRAHEVRLPDGAARPAGASGAGGVGRAVHGRGPHAAHGFPGDAGHPTRGPRQRTQSPRVAARQVGAEARAGRGDGDDAARRRRR